MDHWIGCLLEHKLIHFSQELQGFEIFFSHSNVYVRYIISTIFLIICYDSISYPIRASARFRLEELGLTNTKLFVNTVV